DRVRAARDHAERLGGPVTRVLRPAAAAAQAPVEDLAADLVLADVVLRHGELRARADVADRQLAGERGDVPGRRDRAPAGLIADGHANAGGRSAGVGGRAGADREDRAA